MCRALKIHRSGFYAWTHKPVSDRAKEDLRLLGLIRASYEASGCTYGSRRVYADLREAGEGCGINRVAKIMRENKIRALRGYKKPRYRYSKPHMAVPNQLEQQFTVDRPTERRMGNGYHLQCAQLLEASWTMLPRLEHVWNTFVSIQEGEGRMSAFYYGKARAEAAVTGRTLTG